MSPDRKKRPSKPPRKSHARERHGASTPPPAAEPPEEPAPDRDEFIAIMVELRERNPSAYGALRTVLRLDAPARAAALQLIDGAQRLDAPASPGLAEWSALGAELAKAPHRLALALRVARAATGGGGKITGHEEDELVAWFIGIVTLAITRTGGAQPGRLGGDDNTAAAAIWIVLITDEHRDPHVVRPARCPAVAACPSPGEDGFLAGLLIAAGGYMRTAIAGAHKDEIDDLFALLIASDATLETYRPFSGPIGADEHNSHASDMLEPALSALMKRRATNAEICGGVSGFASAYAQLSSEHAIPPVARIGLIAWLAKVALRDEEQAL